MWFTKKLFSSSQLDFLVKTFKQYFDLQLLILFGSFAKKTTRIGSDIDIGFLTENRLAQHAMEVLIIYIMKFTKKNSVNLVDLFFKDKPSLLQYEIYSTGKVIFEITPNFFEEKRINVIARYQRMTAEEKKIAIVESKLKSLKNLLKNYSAVIEIPHKNSDLINEYVFRGIQKTAEEIIDLTVSINRFILTEYFHYAVNDNYSTFIEICTVCRFDRELFELLAATTAFRNFLTIDYYYGPTWSIKKTINVIKENYPAYIKAIYLFLETKCSNR